MQYALPQNTGKSMRLMADSALAYMRLVADHKAEHFWFGDDLQQSDFDGSTLGRFVTGPS